MLLSTAYFPPVSWFAAAVSDSDAAASVLTLEACENYQKQSYRNRCRILTASGVESLTVPVVHEGGTFKLPIREIKVDYSTPWVMRTERAIASSYDGSAFFEYYRDGIFSILDSRPQTLWELNLRLISFFFDKLGVSVRIGFTEGFSLSPSGPDHRYDIHPKKADPILGSLGLKKPYFQVFSEKYDFQENLSIMDLLFNEGPDSVSYLVRF